MSGQRDESARAVERRAKYLLDLFASFLVMFVSAGSLAWFLGASLARGIDSISVFIVAFCSFFFLLGLVLILSRQTAEINKLGVVPQWMLFARVKKFKIIPWGKIKEIRWHGKEDAWIVDIFVEREKYAHWAFEVVTSDFDSPGEAVTLLRTHISPEEEPEKANGSDSRAAAGRASR